MIFLLVFIVYILKYKKIDLLVDFIRKSVRIEQRSILYFNQESKQNEIKDIKKFILVGILISMMVDFIIIFLSYKKTYILLNSFISPFVIYGLYKTDVKNKFDESYRQLHMELPIILQKIYCLLSIDYPIEEAIYESKEDLSIDILKNEFDHMYNKLSRGYDLCLTLDSFFENLNSQYMMRFKSVLISHYYYGGSSSRENFISLIYDLLEYRVLILREDGEKIKVKLIIPIIIIFASSIFCIVLPIILSLNS